MKDKQCPGKREAFSGGHKLQEAWNRENELVEENSHEALKAGGGHNWEKCFQVGADTVEAKKMEARKCKVSVDRHMQ
jgi:hypothetical protein